jgi:transcriptional regulator with XRE-family HTH domain
VETRTAKKLRLRLRALRAKHGLSQEAFAELAGVNLKHYQEIESGRKSELRISTLERLARPYGIAVYQLLAPDDPPSQMRLKRQPTPHYRRTALGLPRKLKA